MASPSEWLPRSVIVPVIVFAAIAAIVHGIAGFQGVYLNHTSGVWLALARDLTHGIFIRDLVSDAGYGGTRYFPLFFAAIAGLAGMGVSLLTAGWIAGVLSGALLATGAQRALRAIGVPRLTSLLFAAGTVAAYFTQQTVFEIRADVMAAALNLWGLALVLPVFNGGRRLRTTLPAVCFTLAFATKVTALAIPAALLLAAVFTPQRRSAGVLAVKLAFGIAAFLVLAQIGSSGRALPVWWTFLFAGSDGPSTLRMFLGGGFMPRIQYSHLVVALFAMVILFAIFARARKHLMERDARVWAVTVVVWIAASAAVALTLSSPGTVATNQLPEWIACSMLALAASGQLMSRSPRLVTAIVASVVMWMSLQDLARANEQRRWIAPSVDERQRVVERLRSAQGLVLSESPLWPVLAEQPVVILDAFATRAILRGHPEIEERLLNDIRSHRFAVVVLAFDPSSPEGRRMYQFAHFGAPVVDAIVREYRLETQLGSDAFVFVPRSGDPSRE